MPRSLRTPFELIELLRSWFFASDRDITMQPDRTITLGDGTEIDTAFDSEFVVMNLDASLANERKLVGGDGIDLTDGGAGGNATLDVKVSDFIDTTKGLTETSNDIQVKLGSGLSFDGSGNIQSTSGPALDAEFVTMSLSGDLANERVIAAGDGLDLTDGGAGGNVTLTVDVTEFIDTSRGLEENSNNIRVKLGSGLSFGGSGQINVDSSPGDFPSGGVVFWPSTSGSIPSGWSVFSAASGKILVGVDTGTFSPSGATGGQETIDIRHNHSSGSLGADNTSLAYTLDSPGSNNIGGGTGFGTSTVSQSHGHAVSGSTGNSLSTTQSILQPYLVGTWIKKD